MSETTGVGTAPRLKLRRHLSATPEQVFEAWTAAEIAARWWAPGEGWTLPEAAFDARPGGAYRIVMQSPDGEQYIVGGTYVEVDRPRKLVFTWQWEGMDEASEVTVELSAANGGTDLLLTHVGFAAPESQEEHQKGWEACFARLESALS